MEYDIVRSGTTEKDLYIYSQFLSSPFLSLKYLDTNRCTPQYLKWQYLDNPSGKFIGYDAYFAGELVAHFATLPVFYNITGVKTKGLLALNLVTHPGHRGKGLFLKIAEKTFEEATGLGYKFVVGVANQNSTHGLINRLGFKLVAPLDVKIGIGNIVPFRTDNCQLHSLWNDETLLWRLSNPSALYFRNKNNYIVTSTGKPFIYAQLHYQEVPFSNIPKLGDKNSLFKLWIGISKKSEKKGVFINLHNRLKPVPLNFIFKDLTSGDLSFLKEEVFFDLFDFDAY